MVSVEGTGFDVPEKSSAFVLPHLTLHLRGSARKAYTVQLLLL